MPRKLPRMFPPLRTEHALARFRRRWVRAVHNAAGYTSVGFNYVRARPGKPPLRSHWHRR